MGRSDAISYILIDGYNVIGIYHGDMEVQRNHFLNALMEYKKKKGHEITVVFDGWKGVRKETTTVSGGIQIIYSGTGERADDVIKRILRSSRKKWIVISSDRDIMNYSWLQDCVPVQSAIFERKMFEATRHKGKEPALQQDEDDIPEDEASPSRKKGNPRKISKKERLLRDAVDQL